MQKSGRMILMVVAIAMVAALMGSVAFGARKSTDDVKVGVVDIQRVYKDAPRVKQYEEELSAFNQMLTTKLEIRAQNLLLTETEIRELVDLKTKTSLTAADNDRITQLNSAERAKEEELKNLQASKTLTDQQKARLKELQDLQKSAKDTGEALYNDYNSQYDSKGQDIHDKEDADVRAAVSKAADAKGMTMVFDKTALLVGGTDITDDVINKLDRSMK